MKIRVVKAVYILYIVFYHFSFAGSWKSPLNFEFQKHTFGYIDHIHHALSEVAQRELEKTEASFYCQSKRQNIDLTYDNVGNVFFKDLVLYGAPSFRTPTNSKNIALASLQVIFDNSISAFINIKHNVGGRKPLWTRIFKSSGNSSDSGAAKDHLLSKCDYQCESKPDIFTRQSIEFCHPVVHSEDLIFYNVSKNYSKYLKKIWDMRPQNSKITGVVLHVYTRFDMCGYCTYSLDWEMKNANGFAYKIEQYCHEELNKDRNISVHVSVLVSSKQGFLVFGPERRSLPSAPPLNHSKPYAQDCYDNYERQISFEENFDRRTYALYVIPAFIRPIVEENEWYLVYQYFLENADESLLMVSLNPYQIIIHNMDHQHP